MTRNGSKVVYLIEDDGPGVAEHERESIFEPGNRGLAAQREKRAGGAGLGLALARRLARSASGDVTARPDRHGGCFVVTLPSA